MTNWIVNHTNGSLHVKANKVEQTSSKTLTADAVSLEVDGEILEIYQPHPKSDLLREYAEKNGIPVVDIKVSESAPEDLTGRPLFLDDVGTFSMPPPTFDEWVAYMDAHYSGNPHWALLKEALISLNPPLVYIQGGSLELLVKGGREQNAPEVREYLRKLLDQEIQAHTGEEALRQVVRGALRDQGFAEIPQRLGTGGSLRVRAAIEKELSLAYGGGTVLTLHVPSVMGDDLMMMEKYGAPSWFPEDGSTVHPQHGVLLLEDISKAIPSTRALFEELVEKRVLMGRRLAEGWSLIALEK